MQGKTSSGRARPAAKDQRETEFAVRRGSANQERDYNKHSDQRQSGHKPQKHSPAAEKH
jgi:hypothetical protein